ncbi:hypothetical protein WCT67_20670 [Pectobacterium parvum]|uniref:hypothetical protein n=1 Tax=Pectobacterium parvum TaxID=2778550 RepID=UPI001D02EB90|nr:hypothetical protein [Pectobacterium aquaticum]
MLERVALIARLANESCCKERDREIALGLIEDLANGTIETRARPHNCEALGLLEYLKKRLENAVL